MAKDHLAGPRVSLVSLPRAAFIVPVASPRMLIGAQSAVVLGSVTGCSFGLKTADLRFGVS